MRHRFRNTGWWRAAMIGLVMPITIAACGDDEGPSGPDASDFNGTYSLTEDGITNYVRITDNTIEIFSNQGSCYIDGELTIESRDGDVWQVDDSIEVVAWTVEKVGNNIVVEDDEGISSTLIPSDVDVASLTICEENADAEFPHAACSSLTPVPLGGSVSGNIELGDARWSDGTWFDIYRLDITERTDVNLTMMADDQQALDTYLIIFDATGAVRFAEDDDGTGSTDARAQTTLDPGCYIVAALSYAGDEEGETGGGYTLTASTELVADFEHETCTALPEITVGSSVDGVLEDGDARFPDDDTWFDLYSLQVDSEQTVSISLSENGSGIDTFLALYNSLGTLRVTSNDDIDYDGGNYNSLIESVTLDAGCYIILANSYEGDDDGEVGGAYTLSVN